MYDVSATNFKVLDCLLSELDMLSGRGLKNNDYSRVLAFVVEILKCGYVLYSKLFQIQISIMDCTLINIITPNLEM